MVVVDVCKSVWMAMEARSQSMICHEDADAEHQGRDLDAALSNATVKTFHDP